MKETLEKLWEEYFSEKCAVIDTDEERCLTTKAVEQHKRANLLLDEQQKDAVEQYVDTLCDIQAHFVQKAFLKGCEFALSFLLEAQGMK